jgi:3'(2'), 5'-bisphosphate nucleotidase
MGAYKNWIYKRGMPCEIKISETTDMDTLRLAVSRSHRDQRVDTFMEIMSIQHEIPSGSVGRKVAMVINGVADIYVHPSRGTKLWDTCACDVILSEAGGVLLSGTGEKIQYRRPSQDIENQHGLLASPRTIMDPVIQASRQIWGLD